MVTGSLLTCSASATDLDDGTLSPSYTWTVNGSSVGTGSTYTVSASDTDVGDSVICTASATDSSGVTISGSDLVTVTNTAPSLSNLNITSSGFFTNDTTLSCAVTVTDPDESLTPTIQWMLNGSSLASGAPVNLGSYSVYPDDVVQCTATVSDSSGASDTLSGTVTVANRGPNTPTVVIDNQSPEANDTLTCTGSATDADGDSLTLTYNWYVNSISPLRIL